MRFCLYKTHTSTTTEKHPGDSLAPVTTAIMVFEVMKKLEPKRKKNTVQHSQTQLWEERRPCDVWLFEE
jgi:hypothetical protein